MFWYSCEKKRICDCVFFLSLLMFTLNQVDMLRCNAIRDSSLYIVNLHQTAFKMSVLNALMNSKFFIKLEITCLFCGLSYVYFVTSRQQTWEGKKDGNGWNFPPILEKQSKRSCNEFSRDQTDLTTVSVNKVSKQIWIQFRKFERLKIVQNSVEISRNESENAAFVK